MSEHPTGPSPDEPEAVGAATGESGPTPEQVARREFLLRAACIGTGATVVAVPVAAGLAGLLAPLRGGDGGGLKIRLAAISELPEDGSPRFYDVVSERKDAWTKHPPSSLGQVILRRRGDGVQAMSSICPHAGCGVGYRSAERDLFCPCHKSSFALDGERLGGAANKSPRALDELQVDADKLAAGEVWVTFQRFKPGLARKEVLA